MSVFLLPLTAYTLYALYKDIKKRAVFACILIVALAMPLWTDFKIFTDFSHAPIPRLDLDQYVNEWPSGGGVKEAVVFFKDKARNGKIYIATAGSFGLMPYALELYLKDNSNIETFGFWPVNAPPVEVVEASERMPTYVLFYQPCPACSHSGEAPVDWPLKKVFELKKSEEASLAIYEVTK
jgi:hypothetical protein